MKYRALDTGFLIIISLVLLITCEKPERILKFETLDVSDADISYTSVTLKGEIEDLGSRSIEQYGLVLSEYSVPEPGKQNCIEKGLGSATDKGVFQVSFAGLKINTTYYFRAFVVVNGNTKLSSIKHFITKLPSSTTVKDYEENIYYVITVGTQDWMQANLKTEHFSNGEPVLNMTDNSAWANLVSGGMCWYNNDAATHKNLYGGLYNWYAAVDIRNICPAGWHVPTDAEWTVLTNNSGGESVSGGKLKEKGTGLWNSPNISATNESGFTALPGGLRSGNNGTFIQIENTGSWWSFSEYSSSNAWDRGMQYNDSEVNRQNDTKKAGFSVRCIKGPTPLAETTAATAISSVSATINGKVNPNGASTDVTFEYGTTTSYGSIIYATQSPVSGSVPADVSAGLTSLTSGATYHYRVKAVNSGGSTYSNDIKFTTLVPPAATTGSATSITSSSALLYGLVNANNSTTTVTFEYGTSTSYGLSVTADQNPVTGSTETIVSASIIELPPGTNYHFRVKASSAAGTVYGADATFITSSVSVTVIDYDGNVYNVVTIGTQDWMQKNLLVTHYNNGEAIPNITDNTAWSGLTSGAYCWYNNDVASYKDTYGALYNSYTTVDVRNVCPVGWHVPTYAEWTNLTTYLGGAGIAGGKLKETGTAHWNTPNTGATNEMDFTALPGGCRYYSDGNYRNIGINGYWWTSTRGDNDHVWDLFMAYLTDDTGWDNNYNKFGFSIRCLKGPTPLTETSAATAVTSTSVTLNGKVNPNGAFTTVTFEYGTTTSYGSSITATQSPVSGSVPVVVSADLTSLTPGTTHHYRVKATNSGGNTYGNDMTFTTPSQVADVDGNVYNAVMIGTQTWMQENLKTRKYNDNTNIPNVTDAAAWAALTTPAYCWYNNDKSTYGDVYGALYTWYAVNTGKLCPTGWHVPSDAEWTTMENYLIANGYNYDGTTTENKIAKSLAATTNWAISSVTGAVGNTDYPEKRNATGFTALSGGYRSVTGAFDYFGNGGYWWSSTGTTYAWARLMYYNYSDVYRNSNIERNGFSVRCLRD